MLEWNSLVKQLTAKTEVEREGWGGEGWQKKLNWKAFYARRIKLHRRDGRHGGSCFDMSALFMSNQIKLMRFSPSFIVAHSSAEGRTDEHGIIITSNTIIPSPEKCALSDSVSSLKSRLIQLLMLGHDSGWGLRIDAEKLNHVKWNGNNLDDRGIGRHGTRRACEFLLQLSGHELRDTVTSEFNPVDQRNAEASRKCCQKHGIISPAERKVGRNWRHYLFRLIWWMVESSGSRRMP